MIAESFAMILIFIYYSHATGTHRRCSGSSFTHHTVHQKVNSRRLLAVSGSYRHVPDAAARLKFTVLIRCCGGRIFDDDISLMLYSPFHDNTNSEKPYAHQ